MESRDERIEEEGSEWEKEGKGQEERCGGSKGEGGEKGLRSQRVQQTAQDLPKGEHLALERRMPRTRVQELTRA